MQIVLIYKLNNKEGTAAVEFAIIFPLLIVIAFGIIEFGILLYDKQIITNASREGARIGILYQTPRVSDSEIEAVVNKYCLDHLISFGANTSPITTIERTGYNSGDDLTVTVKYQFNFLVLPGFVSSLAGGKILMAKTTMKME